MWNQYYSASVKVPIVRQHKHGTMVIALPFAAAVSLPDYFALCCDVHSNPGPICRQHTHDERNSIPVRISGREVRNEMAFRQQKYFQTCSALHTNNYSNSIWSINHYHARNATNLINVKVNKSFSNFSSKIRFATWNAHSLNKKSATVCDIIISKRLDILAITESWLSGDYHNNNTIAEILNTLNDFNFHHVPRVNRTGGGVGVFLRKGFTVLKNEWQPFSSMECMDLFISSGRSSIRLITIYRPPQSKKNRATPSTFFQEFSSLLEVVSLTPGYLLLNGDFNFHMELQNDAHASTFRELLQSAGLRHHVTKTTHRSGHTLDLIIDRQESKIISNVYTVTDLPSDHNACCVLSRSKDLKHLNHISSIENSRTLI